MDLNGEGLSGILSGQAGAWYYTSNLGAGPSGPTFAPPQVVAPRPAIAALASRSQQLLDVDGSGQIALVDFDPALAGFYQRDASGGWRQFVPFDRLPNIDWGDPNLRFVDLTGDGRADALITEGEVFTWYASEAEHGFSEARRTALPLAWHRQECAQRCDQTRSETRQPRRQRQPRNEQQTGLKS